MTRAALPLFRFIHHDFGYAAATHNIHSLFHDVNAEHTAELTGFEVITQPRLSFAQRKYIGFLVSRAGETCHFGPLLGRLFSSSGFGIFAVCRRSGRAAASGQCDRGNQCPSPCVDFLHFVLF